MRLRRKCCCCCCCCELLLVALVLVVTGMASAAAVNMDAASLIWNSQNHNHPLSYQNLYELYLGQATGSVNFDRNVLSESNFNKIKANYEHYNANRRPFVNSHKNINIFHGSNLNGAGHFAALDSGGKQPSSMPPTQSRPLVQQPASAQRPPMPVLPLLPQASNQIIIFNIGDQQQLENTSSSYVQKFDQTSINYCNFDANLLSSKRSNFQKPITPRPSGFYVNTFLKGESFNESSQITGERSS